ncbi:MAG: hypothetical protein WBQ34_15735 [Candidatus Acidiferrales bacterium]
MAYAAVVVVVIVLLCAIIKAASGDRYANMTEEEFENEAKRSSKVSAAVIGLQKIVDPGHRAEYVQEQQRQVEADSAESGEPPNPTTPVLPKDFDK